LKSADQSYFSKSQKRKESMNAKQRAQHRKMIAGIVTTDLRPFISFPPALAKPNVSQPSKEPPKTAVNISEAGAPKSASP
jgi:hypothetical protein